MNLNCPSKGCSARYQTVARLKKHVLASHVAYLTDFLKHHMKDLNIKQCLIRQGSSSESANTKDDDIVILEQPQNMPVVVLDEPPVVETKNTYYKQESKWRILVESINLILNWFSIIFFIFLFLKFTVIVFGS